MPVVTKYEHRIPPLIPEQEIVFCIGLDDVAKLRTIQAAVGYSFEEIAASIFAMKLEELMPEYDAYESTMKSKID